jgi:hypothetical protein
VLGRLSWLLEAFTELSTCRPDPMMPIPWTAMSEWARENTVLARDRFRYLIRRMDTTYLSSFRAKGDKLEAPDG